MKNTDKAERKEEIRRTREKLKEIGAYEFFIVPLINYIKMSPLKAIGNFFMWALVTYTIFCTFQGIYYDTIYCDADNDNYDGKLLDVYNGYINMTNAEMQRLSEIGLLDQSDTYTYYIECRHNFTRWYNEPFLEKANSIKRNTQKIFLKRT